MKQTAAFKAVPGNVEISPVQYGKAAQNRIAMVAFLVYGIFAVYIFRPDAVGQKFVLGRTRPVFVGERMLFVRTQDFLQENEISPHSLQIFTQFVHHQAPVEVRKPLVYVVSRDMERSHGTSS